MIRQHNKIEEIDRHRLDCMSLSDKIGGRGAVAELADAEDLKSSGGDTLWVQVPPAPLLGVTADHWFNTCVLTHFVRQDSHRWLLGFAHSPHRVQVKPDLFWLMTPCALASLQDSLCSLPSYADSGSLTRKDSPPLRWLAPDDSYDKGRDDPRVSTQPH